MIIAVSGTPGTGKTTLARELADELGFRYIDVRKIIENKKISEEYDKERKCYVIDIDKLSKAIIEDIGKDDSVVDSHLSHHLSSEKADICIITKCSLKVMEKRLKNRGYGKEKIRENMDAEIFDVCLREAEEEGHKIMVVDTTEGFDIKKIAEEII